MTAIDPRPHFLFCDRRIGGISSYNLLREGHGAMQVPPEIRKCVAFLAYMGKGGLTFAGTAFFVSLDPDKTSVFFVYLVTAKHVIAKIKQHSVDGNVLIRINDKAGSFKLVPFSVSAWVEHPDNPYLDVAILPWAPDATVFDYLHYPHDFFLSDTIIAEQNVGVGDEVFMAGLFASHRGKQRNVPIIRIGNIACMPEEPVDTETFGPIDAYIIEARSIGGLSGSPVFANLGPFRLGEGLKIGGGARYYLLGLIHGHWDVKEGTKDAIAVDDASAYEGKINMGMAIVVPFHKITEVLNQPRLQAQRDAQRELRRKQGLPTAN